MSRIPWNIVEIARSCSYETLANKAITMKSRQIKLPEVDRAAPIRVLHRNMLHPARSVREDGDHHVEESVPVALSKANALMEAYFDI